MEIETNIIRNSKGDYIYLVNGKVVEKELWVLSNALMGLHTTMKTVNQSINTYINNTK